jgi:tetratricopeptide (TPR) repeat protein
LGVAYGEKGQFEKATLFYELAIHFNPLCAVAYNNLGVIYKNRDNLQRAIECYQMALKINPRFSQTLNNLGVVYTMQGKVRLGNCCLVLFSFLVSLSLSLSLLCSTCTDWLGRPFFFFFLLLLFLIIALITTTYTRCFCSDVGMW